MTEKTLADVLVQCAAVTDVVRCIDTPVRDDECLFCEADTSAYDHHPDCAWVIAQQVSQSDVNEVRRLARVLRYNGRTA